MNASQRRNRSRKGLGPWRELGQALKRHRQARTRWSQHQFAEKAGASYSLVSLVERGQQKPTLEYLQKIAPVLRLPVEELLTLAGYTDKQGHWLTAPPDAATPPAALSDPLATLHAALEGGPWPEHISAAVFALLAAYAERHRALPDVDDPSLPAVAEPTSHMIVEWRSPELPADEECRTRPAPQ